MIDPTKSTIIIEKVDAGLHRDFKACCSNRGISMKDRFIEVMQDDVLEYHKRIASNIIAASECNEQEQKAPDG